MASKSFQKECFHTLMRRFREPHGICKILVGCDLPPRESCVHRSDEDLMNGNLAQFGEDLCLHLARLQVSLGNINGLFAGGAVARDKEFVSRTQELQVAVQESSERAAALREALRAGLERDAALAPETLSRWVSQRQTAQLHARADLIEQMATVAVELAALSAVEAERLTMTAIMARRQAIALQVERENQL